MFFLQLVGFIFMALFVALMVSQVLIPLVQRRPLFPLFRRVTALEGKVLELQEEVREEELVDTVEALEKQLAEKRQRPDANTQPQ